MIKITVESKNYNYENVGRQGYDLKTEIEVVEDAYATDVVEALVTAMNIAGFHPDSITKALKEIVEDREYEANEEN